MIARPHSVVYYLEFHYTPVHGNWLNMAEIKIGNFEHGCRSRPLEEFVDLRRWAPWNGFSAVCFADNGAGTGAETKNRLCASCIRPEFKGQMGQESNLHPAVVEPAALRSAAFREVHEVA